MEHWCFGSKDIDFTNPIGNTYTITNTNAPSIIRDQSFNGVYDLFNQLLFSVIDGKVYDKQGVLKGTLNGFGNKSSFECSIIPVPEEFNKYYVICSGSYNYNEEDASVSYATVIVNSNGIVFTNGGYLGGYTFNNNITHCGIAISNSINSNDDKYLYIVQGNSKSSSNHFGELIRYLISNTGIANPVQILSTNAGQNIEYTPIEVDLSHDGNMIAWGAGSSLNVLYVVENINTSPLITTITPNNTAIQSPPSYYHGVEFTADNNYLFFTNNGDNIQYVDLTNNNVTTIPGTYYPNSPYMPLLPQIELASDGLMYVGYTSNLAKSINPITHVFGEKEIIMDNNHTHFIGQSCISMFPDQIDGFSYTQHQVNCCVAGQIFTRTTPFGSITSIWTPASNPFQAGQASVSTSASFTINTGTIVTIQNMNIVFGPNAKVIVEPGATLILDNTKFTGLDACETMWPGVEVWGDRTKSQNLWSGNGLNTHQGRIVVKNNSEINNALTAIQAIKQNADGSHDWDKTGGIVELYGNSKFYNNKKAVWIGGYKNYLSGHIGDRIYMRPNRSYITDCQFNTNDNFYGIMDFHSFIALYDGSIINIRGNEFFNYSSVPMNKKGTGIISIISPMQVIPIASDKNVFRNLLYGIKAISFDPSIYYSIVDNRFENCYQGIYMNRTVGAKITSNYFWIPMKDASVNTHPYGLYLDGDYAFHVEDNFFEADIYLGPYGIIANNLGGFENEIYRNHFKLLNYGIQPQLQNKGMIAGKPVGLKLFCNDFDNEDTDYDVLVLGNTVFDIPPFINCGIADAQKISTIVGGQIEEFPAGNEFSPNRQAGTFDFDNSNAEHLVYSHESDNLPIRYKPEHSAYIGFNDIDWGENSERCPSKLGSGEDIPTETALLTQAQLALNSSIVIRNIWKDGGNTNLENEVETTQPWDVYVEFNGLIAESPYLSDEVLMATIDNPAFTSLMIKLIMVANPQASHNDVIMQAIYDRIPALPQSYIDAIMAEESSISQLELLEGNVSADYHLVRSIENRIIAIYRYDTVNTSSYSNMISYLVARPGLEDKYILAATYLAYADYTNMQSVLNSISGSFELNAKESDDYQNYLTTFGIAHDIMENDKHMGDLSQTQINSLQLILDQQGVNQSMAQALLLWNNPDRALNELILEKPANGARMATVAQQKRPEIASLFKVFPNPAKDYFTLQYNSDLDQMQNLRLTLTDMQGKTIRNIKFDNNNIDELIDTQDLKPGVYSVSLFASDLLLEVQRITIVK